VSVATALIPFLEHDDANRALMGANMQRQAVPLLRATAPFIGTGVEGRAARDAGEVILAKGNGTVVDVTGDTVIVDYEGQRGSTTHRLSKFRRSNQGTCINQKPRVDIGDTVNEGEVIADGPSTHEGELALGKNLLVAFMPWKGHNYEDAIVISERLVKDDVLTSIHIEEHEIDPRHQAGRRGDHPRHPEPLRGHPQGPRRARHHPHRCRGRARRHPRGQGHPEG
jgi:DNA-directed RNA polymerase subunit beta